MSQVIGQADSTALRAWVWKGEYGLPYCGRCYDNTRCILLLQVVDCKWKVVHFGQVRSRPDLLSGLCTGSTACIARLVY
jgi:hypothetical protein